MLLLGTVCTVLHIHESSAARVRGLMFVRVGVPRYSLVQNTPASTSGIRYFLEIFSLERSFVHGKSVTSGQWPLRLQSIVILQGEALPAGLLYCTPLRTLTRSHASPHSTSTDTRTTAPVCVTTVYLCGPLTIAVTGGGW